MSRNRRPGSAWYMRSPSPTTYPNGYVRTEEDDLIQVAFFESVEFGQAFLMSREDARLLAKRINQCLDDTARR